MDVEAWLAYVTPLALAPNAGLENESHVVWLLWW